jgi:hypothetical protein
MSLNKTEIALERRPHGDDDDDLAEEGYSLTRIGYSPNGRYTMQYPSFRHCCIDQRVHGLLRYGALNDEK